MALGDWEHGDVDRRRSRRFDRRLPPPIMISDAGLSAEELDALLRNKIPGGITYISRPGLFEKMREWLKR